VVWAESGVLVVHVEDVQRHPISGVQIGTEGDGGSAIRGDDGKARILLAKQTKQGSWVSLQILRSPPGKDFVMNSPWDYRTIVPSFENESENFVKVVIVQRGDRTALESGTVLSALAAQINKANAPKTADKQASQEDPKASLAAVAKQYGLDPGDLDKAIRSWGEKTTDPYEAGLAALYGRNYPEATQKLSESLDLRKKGVEKAQGQAADAAVFLGQALYEEGRYMESASAYQQAAHFREDDGGILNNLGLSLVRAGKYAEAEPPIRRALAIYEKTRGGDDPMIATAASNLANLLRIEGNYADAESLYKRALEIDEKALGPDHPKVAVDLNNLAGLLEEARADYPSAERLYRQALAINEKALGPENPAVATDLNNLALVQIRARGDYVGAEPSGRRALAIDEKAFGSEHPEVATDLVTLAAVLSAKRDYAGSESLLRRALAIDEKVLGPDHPDVARILDNLCDALASEGDLVAAEPLCRRALEVAEKSLGPNHPSVATKLSNIAWLLYRKGDYANSELLYRRALAIDEKAFGPDHPEIALDLISLADLLSARHNYSEAVLQSQRALAIEEKAVGPDHPYTRAIREQLRKFKKEATGILNQP
jgi:tetratricopeptide (TPR) repeat protein